MTHELIDGVHYWKWRGITRLIWFPRIGWQTTGIAYRDGIVVLHFLGRCLVIAPKTPKVTA